MYANGKKPVERRETDDAGKNEDMYRNRVLEKVRKNGIQGPSRRVASVKSRDTSPIVIGGLSVCDGKTQEFLSDCFCS